MADKITVKAEKREGRGKNDTRRLRREGKVPVVVYGGGEESVAAIADLKDLAAILRTDSGVNTLFTFDIAGAGADDVIFQDRQIDPLRGRLVHADLRRFSKGEKIEMTVPIHIIGEAVGLSEEGAVLNQPLHEIKMMVEPSKVRDFIEVDVTNLNVGESIHISDLKFDEGTEVNELPESIVASIMIVKEEELEPQTEEGAEPEVVGEKSKDDESK